MANFTIVCQAKAYELHGWRLKTTEYLHDPILPCLLHSSFTDIKRKVGDIKCSVPTMTKHCGCWCLHKEILLKVKVEVSFDGDGLRTIYAGIKMAEIAKRGSEKVEVILSITPRIVTVSLTLDAKTCYY